MITFNNSLRAILFTFLTVIASFNLSAQNKMEDVVYLNNGSIIRGAIIEMETGAQIKIETFGGSVFVFDMDDVEKIAREKVKYLEYVKGPIKYKTSGYFNVSEIGIMVGNTTVYSYAPAASFTMQTVNGFQFTRWLQTGIGIGMDIYNDNGSYALSPIFLRIGGEVLRKQATPYYFVDAGYAIPWGPSDNTYYKLEGGPTANAGIGVKFHTRSDIGYIITLGYKYQRSKTHNTWWDGSIHTEVRTYQRMSMRFGITF